MKRILFLSVCLICVSLTNAGICPRYPIIRDFDFRNYLGLWHQQDKKQSGWEIPGRCWKSLYMRDPKTGIFKMRMIFENTITRREEKYDSQITLQGPEKPSIIKYTIPLTFLNDELQILATDYTTFSVEYKCDPNGLLEKQESVFLLTRDKNPSPIVLQKAYAIMHKYGIDIRKLERVDQTCGGMTFEGAVLIPQRLPAEHDYYGIPNQDIQEARFVAVATEEDENSFDYFDAPSIVTSAPTVVMQERRPPPRRRFWRPPSISLFG